MELQNPSWLGAKIQCIVPLPRKGVVYTNSASPREAQRLRLIGGAGRLVFVNRTCASKGLQLGEDHQQSTKTIEMRNSWWRLPILRPQNISLISEMLVQTLPYTELTSCGILLNSTLGIGGRNRLHTDPWEPRNNNRASSSAGPGCERLPG